MPLAPPSPNLVVWLKADAGVFTDTGGTTPATNDGDLIALWNDQSGNGNHVLQATSGNRPVFKTNVLGGKPVLRFLTASAQTLVTSGNVTWSIGSGPFWAATVDSPGGAPPPGANALLSFGSISSLQLFMAGPGGAGSTRVVAVGSGYGTTSFAFTQTSGTFYLAEVVRTGGVCSLYQSSAGASPSLDPTTAAQATSIPNDKLYVGTDGGGDNRTGDIAEILIYNARPEFDRSDDARKLPAQQILGCQRRGHGQAVDASLDSTPPLSTPCHSLPILPRSPIPPRSSTRPGSWALCCLVSSCPMAGRSIRRIPSGSAINSAGGGCSIRGKAAKRTAWPCTASMSKACRSAT